MRGLLISGNNLSASMVCCTAHDEVGVVDTTLCDKVCFIYTHKITSNGAL
jgi:hypothetical protein